MSGAAPSSGRPSLASTSSGVRIDWSSTSITKADRQLLALAPNYVADQHAYHRISWPAGVPATVIVSAQTPFPTSAPDAQAWRTAQAQFAQAASNRHLVVAAHSSHDIPVDRPDIVEAQIEAMAKNPAGTA